MRFIGNLLRIYSYLFEAVLCAMAVILAIFLFLNPRSTINLGWLPWTEASLAPWLFGLGILGLIFTVLAVAGRFRFLLFLFAVAALVILTRGLFMSTWTFHGEEEFKRALLLLLAALVAAICAVPLGPPLFAGKPSNRLRG